jgi:hypothetical protein
MLLELILDELFYWTISCVRRKYMERIKSKLPYYNSEVITKYARKNT